MDDRPAPIDGWWRRRRCSFGWAFRGLGLSFRSQENMRIHFLATVLVAGLGLWLGLARWEWCAVMGAFALVWMAEIFNTAIEALVDLLSPERRPLAGKVKDLAAGAVLAAALGAAAIGAFIFVPRLWALLSQKQLLL
jgi:diacylglycerol kinase (ATP)